MTNNTPQYNQSNVDSPLPVLALVFAFLAPLVGAILGHVALSQMRQGKISSTNIGIAKAGLICGWVFTGLWFIVAAFYIVVVILFATTVPDYYNNY
jgi:hypothetical protein